MIYTIDSAHGGNGWYERELLHSQEIGAVWENCGVWSETSQLRHVLLRKPGKEIENIHSASEILWTNIMNPSKAIEQHQSLSEIYRKHGVKIDYIDDDEAQYYPNIMYMRDLFTMTPQGAILSRMASEKRKGEEVIVAKKLAEMKIPILITPINDMILEGPDIVIVNPDLAFIGVGLRTNQSAANYVSFILKQMGFSEIIMIQTTYGCGHLDGVFNLLNSKHAVIVPRRASYLVYEYLKRHGFSIIELSNLFEVDSLMSINFVSINQETVIMNKGAKDTVAIYEKSKVKCIEVDVSELTNGGGSVHCLTGVLKREGINNEHLNSHSY
jgi:N-dimethylarginine dimethylaminohydrolase